MHRKWFANPEEIATLNINYVPVIELAVEEKLNVEISVTNVSAANGLHMLEVIDLVQMDEISVYDFTAQQIEQGTILYNIFSPKSNANWSYWKADSFHSTIISS